ncbi:kinase-like protein [Nadsonia fulvescens var. elongata DSM 6958]|uniref:non-specific serine/threonine protein kinase n=1 Tax=Nadsonia fulvescens var. elongata DSM 6958 TaxID=857566 RepID=A0A1E3PEV1_9ASCO|nr:kinase-like protein [Nadsonia fulvescens var. elongata DSM 6958]
MAKVIPPGAYQPGTALTVGRHNVTIKAYISEGGFAHVYTVNVTAAPPGDDYFRSVVANNDKARSQTDISGNPNKSNSSTPSSSETSIPFTPYVACLKRVAVPDKTSLNLLRGEVEAMQRLKGQKYIVRYIDSHAARASAPNTGYEVFLLMEYCSGNGLIDFMNTRLRDQLKEHEVLKIMYDISQGVAAMHYLTPSLIHRDLKIENVLIADDGTYKLCDFGSVSPILRPPRNQQEFAILDNDIQRHTTVQYRAPEMVDIYRGFPIDEKSDIWALGVFLYKLCYYTTPFEQQGQLAILNATFTFPNHPIFSDRMKRLISILLREDPRARPNIYQVVEEVSRMRNVPVPIKDIYSHLRLP